MILRRPLMIAGAVAFGACALLSEAIAPTSSGQTPESVGKSLGIVVKAEGGSPIVLIPLKAANPFDVARAIDELFRKKVEMIHLLDKESPPKLLVKAPAEIQAEIRGAIVLLESNWQRWPATATKPPMAANPAVVTEFSQPNRFTTISPPVPYGIPTITPMAPPAPYTDIRFNQIQAQNQPRIEASLKKLRDAKGDDEKQTAKAGLRKVLAKIFEEDMNAREKQAKEIETRLAKLRQQYQDRQKAANEILDLQLKVLENEANGIGFPTAVPPTGFTPTLVAPVAVAPAAIAPAGVPLNAPSPMLTKRSVEQFLKAFPAQERVGQLIKEGHFVGSPDGKMYAYLEKSSNNATPNTWEIRICDAATGKVMAVGKIAMPSGPLQFTDEGVATRDADGALILRVPLRTGVLPNAPVRK